MKFALYTSLLALIVIAESAFAQGSDPVNSLARARSTFSAADSDKDGKVTASEFARQRLAVTKEEFAAMDADKDGTWSQEEFLVYYRRLLLNGGQRAAPDLEAEVARIQALRRVKDEEEAKKRPVAPPKVEAPLAPDIAQRLRAAIDDLEKKAALRQATRADFQSVRDALIDRAKVVKAQDPSGGADLVAKFEAAVNALEEKARAGNYSRADYTALRDSLIVRGRETTKVPPTAEPVNASAGVEQLQAGLDRALDELATKAAARNATRADYDAVKAAFVARARAAAPSTDPAVVAERGTLEQRFAAAIDKLEDDGRAGKFSREEFNAVRESHIARVRALAGSGASAASSVPVPTVAPAPANDLAVKLDTALDDLAKKAQERQATRDDFNRVKEAMVARTRALASTNPAAANEQAKIDELFLRAMNALEEDALAGKFSREQFQTMREGYVQRARAVVSAGQPVVAPAPAVPPVPAATPEGIEQRFDAALRELERKALARGASREDFQRVNDLLVARARAAVQKHVGVPVADADPRVSALVTSVQSALTRLESAQADSGTSAADFEKLREMVITRARNAVERPADPAPGRGAVDTTPKRDEAKPVEAPKPVDPPKPADDPAPRGRTRPVTEKPVEPPKPVDPPKPEERPKPTEPPHDRGEKPGRPSVPPRVR
ncbi:MAG: EF-hand domain-containing protein [Planctomycetes bacterium]|nr:EF-hand domain-containing protein [Planctomycetota bacterium]